MTKDDETNLNLGRMVTGMIHKVKDTPEKDTAYARRTITYPGGEVIILIVKGKELADHFDLVANEVYDVVNKDITN